MTLSVSLDEYLYRPPPLEIVVGLTDDALTVDLSIDLEPGEFLNFRRPSPVELPSEQIARLEEAIEHVREAKTLDRRLLPEEARALAAALWHYAGEAEAR